MADLVVDGDLDSAVDCLLKEIEDEKSKAANASELPECPQPRASPRRGSAQAQTKLRAARAVSDSNPVNFSTYEVDKTAPEVHEEEDLMVRRNLPRTLAPLHGTKVDAPVTPLTKSDSAPSLSKEVLPSLSPSRSPHSRSSPKADGQQVPEAALRQTAVAKLVLPHSGIVPSARWGHAMVQYKQSFYVFGGMSNGAPCSDMHEFNVKTASWEACFVSKGVAPSGRYDTDAVVYGDAMVLFGGIGASGVHFGDMYQYHLQDQEWCPIEPAAENKKVPAPRGGHSLVLSGRKMYLFGGRVQKEVKGRKKTSFMNDLWTYDLKNHVWKHVGRDSDVIPPRRGGHAACLCKHRMYIHGGANADQTFSDLYEYDIDQGVWRLIVTSSVPRLGHVLVPVGQYILAWGGFSPSAKGGDPADLLNWYDTTQVHRDAPSRSPKKEEKPPTKQDDDKGKAEEGDEDKPDKADRYGTPTGLSAWYKVAVKGSTNDAFTTNAAGVLVDGFLYSFGGIHVGEPTNMVHRVLVTSDIVTERFVISNRLMRAYRDTQRSPKEYRADLQLIFNGRARYAHRLLVKARCPAFHDTLMSYANDKGDGVMECQLDGNKRRQGIPGVADSDTLNAFLCYLYCGKLPDYHEDRTALMDIAVAHKDARLTSFLEFLDPPRVSHHHHHHQEQPQPIATRISSAEAQGAEQLLSDLRELLHNQEECDVIFIPKPDLYAASYPLKAHSVILGTHSQLLRECFNGVRKEKFVEESEDGKTWKIDLSDVPSSCIGQLLDWMYTGQAEVPGPEAAVEIMKVASLVEVYSLKTHCEYLLWVHSDKGVGDICHLLSVALACDAQQLREQCVAVLADNYESVTESESFKRLAEPVQKEITTLGMELGFRAIPAKALGTVQQPKDSYQIRAAGVFKQGI